MAVPQAKLDATEARLAATPRPEVAGWANAARDALLTGKRYTADQALSAGIVDGKAAEGDLLAMARALATELGSKEPGIFKALKQTWFGSMADALVAN